MSVLLLQHLNLRKRIEEFSEVLKVEAHKLGTHNLSENTPVQISCLIVFRTLKTMDIALL